MKRVGIAVAGLVLGCVLGWLLPLLYPWETAQFTSIGPEGLTPIAQFFGLCLGGPLGYLAGDRLAARWLTPTDRTDRNEPS
jgi:hypothetical protein